MAEKEKYPRIVNVPTEHTQMIEVSEGDVRDYNGILLHILEELKVIRKAVA